MIYFYINQVKICVEIEDIEADLLRLLEKRTACKQVNNPNLHTTLNFLEKLPDRTTSYYW